MYGQGDFREHLRVLPNETILSSQLQHANGQQRKKSPKNLPFMEGKENRWPGSSILGDLLQHGPSNTKMRPIISMIYMGSNLTNSMTKNSIHKPWSYDFQMQCMKAWGIYMGLNWRIWYFITFWALILYKWSLVFRLQRWKIVDMKCTMDGPYVQDP